MNFGYGEILDYLMSSHRYSMEVAMKLDMYYIIEKSFFATTPSERAMMVLDFVLNYDGPDNSSVVRAVTHYAGTEVLSSRVCGVPLISIASLHASKATMGVFKDVQEPSIDLDDELKTRIDGIVELFRLNLKKEQSPKDEAMDLLMKGRDFIVNECFKDKDIGDDSSTPSM